MIARSWPWWRAEFAIGYAAFSAPNIYRETGWLAAQSWKEWSGSGVYGPKGTDLETVAASSSAKEELAHFHALKALGPIMEISPGDHAPGPAARALVEFRNRHWEDQRLRHGVRMSEGGGLGLFHGAIAAINALGSRRPQDAAVKECLTMIVGDEIGHLGGAIADFLASPHAADDDVLELLGECLSLKVEERRQQFAANLGSAPIVDIERAEAVYRERIRSLLSGSGKG